MNIFIAGASGAIGSRLVPQLLARGHEVTAITRSAQNADVLGALGARPTLADALDRAAVVDAVRRAEPEVVINQLTGLAGVKSLKNFDKEFTLTNKLRTAGTHYLLEGAHAAGARRFIAQSYGSWNYERSGAGLKVEEDRLDPNPPAKQRQSLAAIEHLESAVASAEAIEGVALRYGNFYGPGTGLALDGDLVRQYASAGCRSRATVAACGPSSISTTRPPRRWPRSNAARQGSTTWSTTSPCR
jgi:nucleoside-diphosphate-sugar epimerase